MMRVPEATRKGYCEIERGGLVDLAQINSKTRRGRKMEEKTNCLTTQMTFYQYLGAAQRGRYNEGGKIEQQIEIRQDGKSNCLTTVQKDTLIAEKVTKPIRLGHIGNTNAQANRVYSVKGKSVCSAKNTKK